MAGLSGPLDRLNAILSLLQPLDRSWAPSAIGSAIGRPLSRPISHPRTGRSPQPPLNRRPRLRLNSQPLGATKWLAKATAGRNERVRYSIWGEILSDILCSGYAGTKKAMPDPI